MSAGRILIVVTSHTVFGNTGRITGFNFEELAVSYWVFADAGYTVDIASIHGGSATYDPATLAEKPGERPEASKRFLANDAASRKISNMLPCHQINTFPYAGILLVGGWGALWDFSQSMALADIITEMDADQKIIGSIGHGAAGLLRARSVISGGFLVAGRETTCSTLEEEKAVSMDTIAPFILEQRLHEKGAHIRNSGCFKPFTVRDGNLVTGQNVQSSAETARTFVNAVQESQAKLAITA